MGTSLFLWWFCWCFISTCRTDDTGHEIGRWSFFVFGHLCLIWVTWWLKQGFSCPKKPIFSFNISHVGQTVLVMALVIDHLCVRSYLSYFVVHTMLTFAQDVDFNFLYVIKGKWVIKATALLPHTFFITKKEKFFISKRENRKIKRINDLKTVNNIQSDERFVLQKKLQKFLPIFFLFFYRLF